MPGPSYLAKAPLNLHQLGVYSLRFTVYGLFNSILRKTGWGKRCSFHRPKLNEETSKEKVNLCVIYRRYISDNVKTMEESIAGYEAALNGLRIVINRYKSDNSA